MQKMAQFHDLDAMLQFSSHSFQQSAATAMAANSATLVQLQKAGDWESTKIVMRYNKAGDINHEKFSKI